MPRADPTRSAYCATRHLLRNLDDAVELRRNPLVRAYFTRAHAHDADDALGRVRGLVDAALGRCRQRHGSRVHGSLGRMHAALLRCEVDKQPLAIVARELGLSDRQIRRERRTAHDAFNDALRDVRACESHAVVRDTARFRLARATELHDLGQSALGLAACEDIVASAPPEHRIEALCLAAEIERDAGRPAAALARVDHAALLRARFGDELPLPTRIVADERIDFAAWLLRRDEGNCCALSFEPPAIVRHAAAAEPRDQPRLALLLRAIAAYADQRWEVGDARGASATLRRAWQLVPQLGDGHTRERLALMIADALVFELNGRDDLERYRAAEQLAERRGHVRSLAVARAERIGSEIRLRGGSDAFERALGSLDLNERSAPWTIATVAAIAMQVEPNLARRAMLGDLALRSFPARSGRRMIVRNLRAAVALDGGRYDEARLFAHGARNDAEAAGNARVRGGAERTLAAIAMAQRRRRDAVRHLDVAVPALERYGTWMARDSVTTLVRELDVNVSRVYLSANMVARVAM